MKRKIKKNVSRKMELTPASLQQQLWETLQMVKRNKLKPLEANAIATQAREICRVTKVQLEYMRMTNNKNPITSGLFSIEDKTKKM